MQYRTGIRAQWAPDGFVVRIDTSWDGRGTDIACRTADVIRQWDGTAESLGGVEVRDGAPILTGESIMLLCPTAPKEVLPRLPQSEAEAIFFAAVEAPGKGG